MRSWVFRHRLRLRVIYGPRIGPQTPGHQAKPRRIRQIPPGRVVRRGETVVLRPMRPPS